MSGGAVIPVERRPTGWVCPKCERVHAPSVVGCAVCNVLVEHESRARINQALEKPTPFGAFDLKRHPLFQNAPEDDCGASGGEEPNSRLAAS